MRAITSGTTQKFSLHLVTLPDKQVVISSKPLLHDDNGNSFNGLTEKSVREYNSSEILFLAYLELLNSMPNKSITQTKLPAFPVWNNICAFLFGKPFLLAHEKEFPARKIARVSIALACPYLPFATNEVVHAALCGDVDLTKHMITGYARYLLLPGTATDFSGRTYTNITAFQATLVTGDTAMAEMIKPFFNRIPNGQIELQRQFLEFFPHGFNTHHREQQKKSETDFKPILNAVISVIKNSSDGDLQAVLNIQNNESVLGGALDTFRKEFTKLSLSEKIFNPWNLLKAFRALANEFTVRNKHQLDLYWIQVVGFMLRFLPANYAQIFAHRIDAIDNIAEFNLSWPRSFEFHEKPNYSFFPLSADFGFKYNCVNLLPVYLPRIFIDRLLLPYEKLCQEKIKALTALGDCNQILRPTHLS